MFENFTGPDWKGMAAMEWLPVGNGSVHAITGPKEYHKLLYWYLWYLPTRNGSYTSRDPLGLLVIFDKVYFGPQIVILFSQK